MTTDLLYLEVAEELSQGRVLLGDLRECGQTPDHPVHGGVVDIVQSSHLEGKAKIKKNSHGQ